jgi:hypothetical protein
MKLEIVASDTELNFASITTKETDSTTEWVNREKYGRIMVLSSFTSREKYRETSICGTSGSFCWVTDIENVTIRCRI